MTPIDLNTPEGRAAYRKELRQVARGVRWAGIGTALAGVGVGASRFFIDPWPPALRIAALVLCLVGISLMLYGIFVRTRYHVRRMAELR